jgi:hypothetical protein
MIFIPGCLHVTLASIPGNPTIVPKNLEVQGAWLANWLYNVGAKDGTVIGTIGRGTCFDPCWAARRTVPGRQVHLDRALTMR